MKKLMLLILIPSTAFGLTAEEIGILLNSKPSTYQGQLGGSPQADIILKESYIKNGSIFGQAPQPSYKDHNEIAWQSMQQGLRRAEIQHAEREALRSQQYYNPFGRK